MLPTCWKEIKLPKVDTLNIARWLLLLAGASNKYSNHNSGNIDNYYSFLLRAR